MAQWKTDPPWTPIEQINNGTTFHSFLDISADDFNKLVENMQYLFLHNGEGGGFNVDAVYPVGSIYMTLDKFFNPANAFGGAWAPIYDRFLLGAGQNYSGGSTGGYKDAVVVAHSHEVQARGGVGVADIISGYETILETGVEGTNDAKRTATAGESGVGKNMPPYLAVYMWQRTD